MQDRKYRSLGFDVVISVPSTVEENDQLAGRANATLEDAVDNVVYRSRGGLPTFRELLAAGVEKETGIAREAVAVMTKGTETEPSKQKLDDEGNPLFKYTESESDYIDRVLAKTGRTRESFVNVAAEAAKSVKYDPKASERGEAGPKTPPKSVYEQVDAIIAAGSATSVAASLGTLLGRTVETDRDSLAKGIHEYQLNEMRKIKNTFAVKA